MKSEVKQLSSLLQQLQSFLKSLNVHPPPQQQQPGRGGGGGGGGGAGHGGASSSGGGGGGGSSAGVSGTSGIGKMATTTSSSSGQQGVIQHGQPNRQTQQHVHHSGVPDASSRLVQVHADFDLFFLSHSCSLYPQQQSSSIIQTFLNTGISPIFVKTISLSAFLSVKSRGMTFLLTGEGNKRRICVMLNAIVCW